MPAAKPPAQVPAKPAEPKKDEKKAEPAAPAKPAEPKKDEKKAGAADKKTSATDRGLRTWTDSTGKYQVEARLVATLERGIVVRLLRADGRYVRVTFDRLSQADRLYVLSQDRAIALNW